MSFVRVGYIFLFLSFLGCSYAISPDMTKRADRTISFEKLYADPQTYAGRIVILGGVIGRIENLKKGTLIEIVQKELDYWGKPQRTDKTGGRFLVLHPGYLDVMIYAPGREITVAGEVSGTEQKALGEVIADYPLILFREMKLWPRQAGSSWDKPEWLDPLRDPRAPDSKFGY